MTQPPKVVNGEVRDTFRRQFFKTELCRFFLSNTCAKGTNCTFAHSFDELRVLPDLRKTSLCDGWRRGSCPLSPKRCRYAHGKADLRVKSAGVDTALAYAKAQSRPPMNENAWETVPPPPYPQQPGTSWPADPVIDTSQIPRRIANDAYPDPGSVAPPPPPPGALQQHPGGVPHQVPKLPQATPAPYAFQQNALPLISIPGADRRTAEWCPEIGSDETTASSGDQPLVDAQLRNLRELWSGNPQAEEYRGRSFAPGAEWSASNNAASESLWGSACLVPWSTGAKDFATLATAATSTPDSASTWQDWGAMNADAGATYQSQQRPIIDNDEMPPLPPLGCDVGFA